MGTQLSLFKPRYGHQALAGKVPSVLPAGNWTLALYDDFDGPSESAPDQTIWAYWLQNQARRDATNRAPNTCLNGLGSLRIRTTSQDIGFGAEASAGGVTSLAAFGLEFYMETRAALQDAAWFAYWSQTRDGMNGVNTPPDPADGAEYDIIEAFQGGNASSNLHYGGYGANHHEIGLSAYSGITQANFNVYGMHMSVGGGFTRYYVNGTLARTSTTIQSTRTDQEIRLTHEYELAMGSISTPRITLVDYARVWVPA